MSTLKTTFIQHPSATNPNIELAADGTVVLPLSDLDDLADVNAPSPSDGEALVWDSATSKWVPEAVVPTSLDASVIDSGTLDAARIPNLDASKTTTGTFNAARIPNLDASKTTTGTFNAARIPNLDASKTTSGVFNIARIPNAAKAGIGTNVVQAVKTDTFAQSVLNTSLSNNIPGLTATITPSSATSKVLVLVSLQGQTRGAMRAVLFRNNSQLTAYIGNAAGSRPRASGRVTGGGLRDGNNIALMYLDSPGVIVPVTYSVRIGHGDDFTTTRTVFVNRNEDDLNEIRGVRTASSITAIEVAG
jgi:hypothetical protein